jgi:hypothetical protein
MRAASTAHAPSPRATPTSPRIPAARGEGWGEGQRYTQTLHGQGRLTAMSAPLAAPPPAFAGANPLPASGERGFARHSWYAEALS